MKVRESGMPPEDMWAGFFNPDAVLHCLGVTAQVRDAAEFGCGYGTFTIPAARIICGTLHAFDIEPGMIEAVRAKADAEGIENIALHTGDFMADGTGIPDNSLDYVMLFNILHTERPVELLRKALRMLHPGGKAGVIHWRHDSSTPRGPSMNIRPTPEQCLDWLHTAGYRIQTGYIDLPPYHYGIVAVK